MRTAFDLDRQSVLEESEPLSCRGGADFAGEEPLAAVGGWRHSAVEGQLGTRWLAHFDHLVAAQVHPVLDLASGLSASVAP